MSDAENNIQPLSGGSLPPAFYEQFGRPSDPWDPYYTSTGFPEAVATHVDHDELPAAELGNLPSDGPAGEIVGPLLQDTESIATPNLARRIAQGVRRNKVIVGAGALSVGSLVASPVGETVKSLAEAVPEIGTGLLAAEAVWIGGALIALAAPGKDGQRTPLPKTINPLKLYQAIKTRFSEIGEGAGDSPWFKAGFAINGVGMLAQFAIPTAGIMMNFAPKTWGLLAWPVIELAGAIALRREILKRVGNNSQPTID